MGAHYHCIICSATITRRTDMIGHINRHVNKGETESRFITGKFWKTFDTLQRGLSMMTDMRKIHKQNYLGLLMRILLLIFQNVFFPERFGNAVSFVSVNQLLCL